MLYLKTIGNISSVSRGELRRIQHTSGIELLKRALLEERGIKINESDIIYGEHGKPMIKENNVHFSISHCGPYVALLLSTKPCGVDIEEIRPVSFRTKAYVCKENELKYSENSPQRFITLWTLKESYVKAIGRGLGFGLKNIEFKICGDKIISCLGGKFFSFIKKSEYGDFMISGCFL